MPLVGLPPVTVLTVLWTLGRWQEVAASGVHAQVVCGTLLRAVSLLGASQQQQGEGSGCSAAGAGESSAGEGSAGDGAAGSRISAALLAAWQPYVYGWKRPWWEAVAVPDDVEDEDEFRGQLR